MSAQQRMKVANEKASKNITQRGNVVKPVSKNSEVFFFDLVFLLAIFFNFYSVQNVMKPNFYNFWDVTFRIFEVLASQN